MAIPCLINGGLGSLSTETVRPGSPSSSRGILQNTSIFITFSRCGYLQKSSQCSSGSGFSYSTCFGPKKRGKRKDMSDEKTEIIQQRNHKNKKTNSFGGAAIFLSQDFPQCWVDVHHPESRKGYQFTIRTKTTPKAAQPKSGTRIIMGIYISPPQCHPPQQLKPAFF